MAADAEATLPALIDACRRLVTDDRRRAFGERRQRLEQAHVRGLEAARAEAAYAWDASPISTARLAAEVWAQIRNEDWSFVSESGNTSDWVFRLWNFTQPYHNPGNSRAPRASAMAHRRAWAARSPTRNTGASR